VLAEDILPDVTDQLSDRVQRQRLDNVAVKLGTPDDPQLPAHTFDRIFLVHMYHEVASPYAFLWHMREGLKADGLVIVVDADRPVKLHGMPPAQLRCELAALNLKPANFTMLTGGETYFMAFRAVGPRPSPQAIRPCASG
jgi:SAM-dependent methyltransferase